MERQQINLLRGAVVKYAYMYTNCVPRFLFRKCFKLFRLARVVCARSIVLYHAISVTDNESLRPSLTLIN